ncbi:MAG: rhomboid family intramembrane serine protease [Terriglobia bacterium]|jgi:membrane associated rhomboid family serine protease/Tfp pilus assembly protein PilF
MAKCSACRKQFPAPFWKLTTICPECKSAQLELHAKLQALTPTFIVTPCLVGLNAVVFCLMVVSGVSITEPDLSQLIHWGASFGPLTLGSQPWRVVSSMFVHIGIIHILFNMWCLWSLGKLAERLMGNWNFLILYLLSGLGGSLLSLWLHPHLVCAGASGAIFGVAGGLVAILGLKRAQIPGAAMKRTFKSVLFFVGYNLLYGMRGGIDNAAHLGGLLSGAALGAFMPQRSPETPSLPWLRQPPQEQESPRFKLAGAALACLLIVGFGFVRRGSDPTAGLAELDALKIRQQDRTTLAEGAKLLQSGKTGPAIEKLKTVTAHAPGSFLAHLLLGEAYRHGKQYDEAMEEFHKAIDLEPNFAETHAELGLALRQKGQNDQAIAEYRKALALKPDDPAVNNNLGYALAKMGRHDEAITALEKSLHARPDNAETLDSLGFALAGKGQYEAAIGKYRQALKNAPAHAVIHLHLAQALTGLGRLDEAKQEFAEANRLDPQIQTSQE